MYLNTVQINIYIYVFVLCYIGITITLTLWQFTKGIDNDNFSLCKYSFIAMFYKG